MLKNERSAVQSNWEGSTNLEQSKDIGIVTYSESTTEVFWRFGVQGEAPKRHIIFQNSNSPGKSLSGSTPSYN